MHTHTHTHAYIQTRAHSRNARGIHAYYTQACELILPIEAPSSNVTYYVNSKCFRTIVNNVYVDRALTLADNTYGTKDQTRSHIIDKRSTEEHVWNPHEVAQIDMSQTLKNIPNSQKLASRGTQEQRPALERRKRRPVPPWRRS